MPDWGSLTVGNVICSGSSAYKAEQSKRQKTTHNIPLRIGVQRVVNFNYFKIKFYFLTTNWAFGDCLQKPKGQSSP